MDASAACLLWLTFDLSVLDYLASSDLLFMETSALTGECVDEVFIKCATSIVNKIDNGTYDIQSIMPSKGDAQADANLEKPPSSRCAC